MTPEQLTQYRAMLKAFLNILSDIKVAQEKVQFQEESSKEELAPKQELKDLLLKTNEFSKIIRFCEKYHDNFPEHKALLIPFKLKLEKLEKQKNITDEINYLINYLLAYSNLLIKDSDNSSEIPETILTEILCSSFQVENSKLELLQFFPGYLVSKNSEILLINELLAAIENGNVEIVNFFCKHENYFQILKKDLKIKIAKFKPIIFEKSLSVLATKNSYKILELLVTVYFNCNEDNYPLEITLEKYLNHLEQQKFENIIENILTEENQSCHKLLKILIRSQKGKEDGSFFNKLFAIDSIFQKYKYDALESLAEENIWHALTTAEILSFLLKRGVKLTPEITQGLLKFCLIPELDTEKLLKILIEDGEVDVNLIMDYENYSLPIIFSAVANKHIELLRYLLDKNAKHEAGFSLPLGPLSKNPSTLYPVHLAAIKGYWEIIKVFLQHGIGINLFTSDQQKTCMHIAAENGDLKLLTFLIGNNAQHRENKNGWFPLHSAVAKGKLEIVKYLIEECKIDINLQQINQWQDTPLHTAANFGQYEVLKYLLEKNAQVIPNAQGKLPLHLAAEKRQVECVKLLLKQGKDINSPITDSNANTALHLAAQNDDLEMVQTLKENGATHSSNNNGWFPLHAATAKGNIKIIQYFIEECKIDIDLKQTNQWQDTPLHTAAANGQANTITYLLSQKNITKAPQTEDFESFVILPRISKLTIQEPLQQTPSVKQKAAIIHNGQGEFPLHLAVKNGHLECVKLLLQHGHDINCITKDAAGNTALHLAAENDNVEMVKLLIEKGAKIIPNQKNLTPFHLAAQADKIETIKFFLEYQYGKKNLTDLDAFIESCEMLLQVVPNNFGPWHNLGCHYFSKSFVTQQQNEFLQKAENAFKKSIELKSRSSIYAEYANFLFSQKRYEEALFNIEKSINCEENTGLYFSELEKQNIPEGLSKQIPPKGTVSLKGKTLAYYLSILCLKQLCRSEEADKKIEFFQEEINKMSENDKKVALALLHSAKESSLSFWNQNNNNTQPNESQKFEQIEYKN